MPLDYGIIIIVAGIIIVIGTVIISGYIIDRCKFIYCIYIDLLPL